MLQSERTSPRRPSLTSVGRNRIEEKRAVERWHAPGRDERTLDLHALHFLRAVPPGQVLSIYADADARNGASRNPGWWIALKGRLSDRLEEIGEHDEATAFARLGAWVLERLQDEIDPGALRRGMAIFATETPRRLEVLMLPLTVEPMLFWAPDAAVGPLEELVAAHPTIGIAILDGWHARFVTSWLGTPIGERVLERTEETDDWREMKGRAATDLVAGARRTATGTRPGCASTTNAGGEIWCHTSSDTRGETAGRRSRWLPSRTWASMPSGSAGRLEFR